jgi:hypothetical protein
MLPCRGMTRASSREAKATGDGSHRPPLKPWWAHQISLVQTFEMKVTRYFAAIRNRPDRAFMRDA